MGRIWSDENKFRSWLTVETAAAQTLARFGLVPQAAADAIAARGNFTVARIHEIEAEVRHDVIAFTTAVAEQIDAPPFAAENPPAGSTSASPPPTSSTPRSPSNSAKPRPSSAPESSRSPKP